MEVWVRIVEDKKKAVVMQKITLPDSADIGAWNCTLNALLLHMCGGCAMACLGKKHYCTGDSTYELRIQAALDGLANGTYKTVVAAAKAEGVLR